LRSGYYIPISDKPYEYLLYSWCFVKFVAGDAQPEAVFGYFYPADGGAGEE